MEIMTTVISGGIKLEAIEIPTVWMMQSFESVYPETESWWTRTAAFLGTDRLFDNQGNVCNTKEKLGIRPLLKAEIEDGSMYQAGQTLQIGKYSWTVVKHIPAIKYYDEIWLLCDAIINMESYGETVRWSTSNANRVLSELWNELLDDEAIISDSLF